MSENVTYPGMPAFLEGPRAGVDPAFGSKLTSNWLLNRVNDALAQLSVAPAEHRAAGFAEARKAITAMNAATAGAVAAVDFAMKHWPPPQEEEQPDATHDHLAAKRAVPEQHAPLAPEPAKVTPPPAAQAAPPDKAAPKLPAKGP